MNTVITCLLILSVIPLICSFTAGYFKQQQLGKVDNKDPRGQAAQLTGPGARAVAAQANSWEALAVFTAAVLAVSLSGVALAEIANLAVAFTVLRIVYVPIYMADQDKLRSLTFIAGFGICMYLFYTALAGA